ncbi:MAG: LysR family transcriptional regulator [Polyangiaceae bacterium]|nr:LysR family transcriptional regulator [Polyangiaceae bacterium]
MYEQNNVLHIIVHVVDSPIHVTLDHARALDALATAGTLQRAAAALHKGHTAVLHALRSLEAQTELELLDRSAYRLKLTPAGERVLDHCRRLLAAERDLVAACQEMRSGWEPRLGVVFDGILPAEPILRVVGDLAAERAPTRVHVSAEFLGGVEEAFARQRADLMLSVLTPRDASLVSHALPPVRALLVAHTKHPLTKVKGPLCASDLGAHLLLTVHGSDPRLELPTAQLEARSTALLNDFVAKKDAILAGIGFGWLPEHLARRDLKSRALAILKFEGGWAHTCTPRLYLREGRHQGRATKRFVDALVPRGGR